MAAARKAKGKKSRAISDRSGFNVPYKSLKTTWDGLRVEPEEWEPKQPQLTPARNVIDATALFQPRPDNDPENVDVCIGYNYDPFVKIQDRPPVGVPGFGVIGFAFPRFDHDISVTGLAGTGEIGTEVPTGSIDETGVAGTGAIGTVSITHPSGWGESTWGVGPWGEGL
jgi:hypothetical protein